MTRSWSEKKVLQTLNAKLEEDIKKFRNQSAQLEEVMDPPNCNRRTPTMPYTSIVGTTKQRRKRSRSASHHLLCYRQPPRSTTTGSATSRTATGARTVLPDARSESAEALELWDGNQAAT